MFYLVFVYLSFFFSFFFFFFFNDTATTEIYTLSLHDALPIRNSRGSIVLRHGNRTLVEGNLMIGGSSGIRFYENDHVIINNLIQGGSGQIIAGSGTIIDDTTGGTEHARPDRVLVAFNTIAGNRTDLIDVGWGNHEYGPDDCTFANNI